MFRRIALGALVAAGACAPKSTPETEQGATGRLADAREAAQRTFVEPGKLDEFYLFYSGRPLGTGLRRRRSRPCATSPRSRCSRRTPPPATASTTSRRRCSAAYLGRCPPSRALQDNGDYDGRWLFVNDNANNRLARIDLRDFKTRQILGPIANSSGNHGSAFVTENSEYALVASRFSIPLPQGSYAPI